MARHVFIIEALQVHLQSVRDLIAGLPVHSFRARPSGTAVETDPAAAIDEVDRLCIELDEWNDASLARPIVLRTLIHAGASPVSVRTTLEREAAFVIQHTIHHCATLAVLLERMNLPVPRDLGYAPSTPDSSRARQLARG